jgi:hypothetical protein
VKLPTPIELLTEREWSEQVADLARLAGWRRYHTFNSKKSHSGFPDETLVRDRVVFLELKTEQGRPSPAQREWLTDLIRAGAEVYVVRPRDLQELAYVLAARNGATAGANLAASTRAELGLEPPAPP